MAGWDLKSGPIKEYTVSEEDLWKRICLWEDNKNIIDL